jgi:ureidoacrylate peracid hydrolase
MAEAFARNAHYWKLWPELEVEGADLVIDKTRFGAFVPGASRLHEVLQERGIDTLIITGTLTNCCCESTARDAMQMNYKIIFVADANAALTDAAHNATLDNMLMLFADVMTTDEVVNTVRRAR